MTKGTGDGIVLGEARVEVQLLAQLDFLVITQIRRGGRHLRRQRADLGYGYAIDGDHAVRCMWSSQGKGRTHYEPYQYHERNAHEPITDPKGTSHHDHRASCFSHMGERRPTVPCLDGPKSRAAR